MNDDLLVRAIRARLVGLRRNSSFYQSFGPSSGPVERAPVLPGAYCGPLLPAPWSWRNILGRGSGNAARDHNHACYERWNKIPCPGCGGEVTAGWGVMPDEPMDPGQPPKFCYGCDLRRIRQEPRPCFVPFVDENDFFAEGGARILG